MNRNNMKQGLHESKFDMLMTTLHSIAEINFISKLSEALQKRGLSKAKLVTLTLIN